MRSSKMVFASLAALFILTAAAPPPTIETLVRANSHSLTVNNGILGGDGGVLIRDAVKDARFVALGEDHFTVEVPAFGEALCNLMAGDLAGVVVEAGPIATRVIAPMLKRPDREREREVSNFMARYPNAVAFLDSRSDNAFAAHCGRVSHDPHFALIGVDQEFVGSAGLIIDQVLRTRLSPQARKVMLALRAEEQFDAARARASGDPSALLLLSINDERIAEVRKALAKGASPEAQSLFNAFVESHAIYEKNRLGGWDANLARSKLMKRQFVEQAPDSGRLLLKFGDFHMYKGVGPRGLRDLGNYVAEIADGEGRPSLHILMLGAGGVHATFGGYARPTGREAFSMVHDPEYRWLTPVLNSVVPGAWTVVDLRPFRQTSVADLDLDWRRIIDGYDLLIVVPKLTPSPSVGDGTELQN